MHRVHTKRGFTLIELLVVIAIIGILATIVIIQLGGAQTRARNSNAKSDVTEIGKALETYKTTSSNDNTAESGTFTAAAVNSSSAVTVLGANSTALQSTVSNGGFFALFNTASTFPVTVSKTPSTAYTYVFVTNPAVAAGPGIFGNFAATSYCVGTDIVTGTGGVTDFAFYVNNGSDGTSTTAAGALTPAAGGTCS